jgi:ferrous iron transport protein A
MPFDADADAVDAGTVGDIPTSQPPPLPEGESLERLTRGTPARVLRVNDVGQGDPIAERLRELGFVAGEPVRIVAAGPLGGEPLLVQIGFTRFALRKAEAARVLVLRQ